MLVRFPEESREPLVDRLAAIFFGWFIVEYATLEQKRAIIDRYVLGKDINEWYPILIVCVLAGILFWAQHAWWRSKYRLAQEEIERLSEWKSRHQQQNIDTELHHTEP